jgi:hypothetical protein
MAKKIVVLVSFCAIVLSCNNSVKNPAFGWLPQSTPGTTQEEEIQNRSEPEENKETEQQKEINAIDPVSSPEHSIKQQTQFPEAIEDHSHELTIGESYSMLDGSINIRSAPGLEGNIIGKLNLHDRITIIGNTYIEQKIENILAYWYKIKYRELEGFIWGGYIASKRLLLQSHYYENDTFYFYYRYTKYNSYTRTYCFDIENDVFVYRNNKRINFPPSDDLGIFNLYDDADVFQITGIDEIVIHFNVYVVPQDLVINIFSINKNDQVKYMGTGYKLYF